MKENEFLIRDGLFDSFGRMQMSTYQWFRAEMRDMEDAYKRGDLKEALEHEKTAEWAIYFTAYKGTVNDMEYELYISNYTQLHHPRRKLTVISD